MPTCCPLRESTPSASSHNCGGLGIPPRVRFSGGWYDTTLKLRPARSRFIRSSFEGDVSSLRPLVCARSATLRIFVAKVMAAAATPVAMTKSSQQRYRDVGGTSDQRTQLSTARWPCAPNSRWQLSLMRSGTRSGSSGPQAVKRTSDNIKSNILI